MAINRIHSVVRPNPTFHSGHQHVDEFYAERFIRALEVPDWVEAHLQTGCDMCHEQIYLAFDAALVRGDFAGFANLDEWKLALGDRFLRRHACPTDLFEQLRGGSPSAMRHVDACPLCAAEVKALERMSWVDPISTS